MKHTLLYLLGSFFFIGAPQIAHSQKNTPAQPLSFGEWFTSWRLCEPIPLSSDAVKNDEHLSGFTIDYLPGKEKNKRPDAISPISYAGKTYRWHTYQSPDSILDLGEALHPQPNSIYYVYTEKELPTAKTLFLSLGSDDGGQLYVNGTLVWEGTAPRYARPDDNLIPVQLQKGTNHILFKLENKGGNAYLCMRALPFEEEALTRGASRLYDIAAKADGQILFVPRAKKTIIDPLVRQVTVTLKEKSGEILLKKQPQKATITHLLTKEIPQDQYIATLEVLLKSGNTLRYDQPLVGGTRHQYTLFEAGKSDYAICLSSSASPAERFAGQELQAHLQKISGILLPIDTLSQTMPGRRIWIGHNASLTSAPKPDAKDESFLYENIGGDLLIYGGAECGTLYGVYSFLENELGCRWYTPEVTLTPTRHHYTFTKLKHSETPGIAVRNNFYVNAFNPLWSIRNRNNGTMGGTNQIGSVEGYWGCHTFQQLVPPAQYFDQHPEYFSLINGKRLGTHYTQLCLSNPEVLKICTEGIRNIMRTQPDYRIYDVSQNDGDSKIPGACQCEKCQEIVRKYGGESGIMIWFVNQIAAAVKDEFPDKYIGTFAYTYSRKPPVGIKPASNVVVRLCSIECCFLHDFKSCPENQAFLKDLQEWAALAPHLYIWDYVVTFSQYIAPFPNFYVLQPNIQTFRENHAIGIMEQGAYQSPGAEFSELRTYLLSKLLWNPQADVEAIINDFMYGYYGRSGQYIRAYFDLLHQLIQPNTHMTIYPFPDNPILTNDFLLQAKTLFDKAEAVADNEEILRRVEIASLPIYYLRCCRFPEIAVVDGTYDRLKRIAEQEKITQISEWVTTKDFFAWLDTLK